MLVASSSDHPSRPAVTGRL